MWAFIGAKAKNVTQALAAKNPHAGDIWLWVAIDADSKIVPCWMLGGREANTGAQFLDDLRKRLVNRVQLTSDGHRAYLEAVDYAWGGMDIDYAMLVKLYSADRSTEARYSPAECIGCKSRAIIGNPDPDHISTSFAERQNARRRSEDVIITFHDRGEFIAPSPKVAMRYPLLGNDHSKSLDGCARIETLVTEKATPARVAICEPP